MTKLRKQNKEYQMAPFLHAIGPDPLIIYNGFQFASTKNLDMVIAKFDQHFIEQTNEQYVLNKKKDQKEGENIDSYLNMLRNLVKSYNFCECLHDSLLHKRIVLDVSDNQILKRILFNTKSQTMYWLLTYTEVVKLWLQRKLWENWMWQTK